MTNKTGPTSEARAKAARTRLKRKQDKEDSIVHLDGGAVVYQDTLPGVGFVLQFKSRKCYYKSSKMAIDFWYREYAEDFGAKDDLGVLTPAQGDRVITRFDWAHHEGAKAAA